MADNFNDFFDENTHWVEGNANPPSGSLEPPQPPKSRKEMRKRREKRKQRHTMVIIAVIVVIALIWCEEAQVYSRQPEPDDRCHR